MTQFPWKIFKGGREIVFPIGARRFITVSVQPIPQSGGLRRTIAGSAVWTGHSAFNLHAVSLSCSDQTQAPIFDLWPGDIVQIELPDVFSAPGPSAVLKYDPVPGTVVGVDADDQVVGVQTSASRNVSIPGAVAIRFRPTMNCMVVDRSTSGTQGRQNGQWSLSLEELSGAEDLGGDVVDSVSVDAVEVMSTVAEGEPWTFDVSPYVSTTTGLALSYALLTEHTGLAMDAATGVITWDAVPAGAYAVVFRASSGVLSQEGMVPVYGEKAPEVPVVWAEGTGGIVTTYTDVEGKVWRVHTFNAASSFVASKAGAVETLVVGGGGGGGYNTGGGGGAGGVPAQGVVRLNVAPGSHAVTVGAGGATGGSAFGNRYGRKGSESSFAGIVGQGGGGGIGGNDNTRGTPDGGSGGGDGASSNSAAYSPGTGIAGQGFAGGLGNNANTAPYASAGGGGAGEPGFNYNSPTRPRSGGNGISSGISGSEKYYAGGGAGSMDAVVASGGLGGGGNSAQPGQANTGGGGGGGSTFGGNGGSGIVVIRYRIS